MILALDLGTSGAKAALIDPADGSYHGEAFEPYPTDTGADGRVEQHPADWVAAARACAARLPGADAIALTGQMQDLICLDADGSPMAPAVLYSDTRARAEADALHRALGDWNRITGNEQSATSNAAMFMRSGLTPARILFSPSGYLAHHLGLGAHVDSTTASTTGFIDAATGDFSPAVRRAAGVTADMLPAITDGPLGEVDGVPVILAPGDAVATTAGIVGLAPGDDYVYLGTSGWYAFLAEKDVDLPGAVHRLAAPGRRRLHIAALSSAGALAGWGRENLLGGASPAEADAVLAAGPRAPSGLLALPSLSGERFPVRDDALGAAITGIRATTTPAQMYRALLESVAFGLSHAMAEEPVDRPLPVVGGGAASRPWLEILADVTGRPVTRVSTGGDAALTGAALVAAEALGLEHGIMPLGRGDVDAVAPDAVAHAGYRGLRARHRRLYSALGDTAGPPE